MRSGGRNGKPLSARSVKHAFALLSAALRWSVRQQILTQNVCDAAESPALPRSKVRVLAADEVARLVNVVRGTRWKSFVDLALMLGARRGELLALTWADVDYEAARYRTCEPIADGRRDCDQVDEVWTGQARSAYGCRR